MNPAEELVEVVLVGVPLELHQRSQEHGDELVRELSLISEQMRADGDVHSLPPRLVGLIGELTGRYGAFTAEAEERLEQAYSQGRSSVDLVFRVPDSVASASRHLAQILDEADEYCRAGRHLLTLASPAELVRYRRWYLGEFIEQVAGRPPLPWPQFAG
jgi:hypothetical protein